MAGHPAGETRQAGVGANETAKPNETVGDNKSENSNMKTALGLALKSELEE